MHHVRWTVEKITARLELVKSLVYRQSQPIDSFKFHAGTQALTDIKVDDRDWEIIEPKTYWGKLRQEYTLRSTFRVPDHWEQPVALHIPLGISKSLEALSFLYGPEALAYLDGKAFQGIDPNHQEILLPNSFLDDSEHHLALYGWVGIKDEQYEMGQPQIVQIDQPTREFVTISRTALDVVNQLPEDSPIRINLINALDKAFLLLDLRMPLGDGFYESISVAYQRLQEAISNAGPATNTTVTGVGHAHIDVAWLWSLSQTRNKAARTFSSVLRLMEKFPDFYFTQSQPQLYQYISEDHPEIMSQIKERVEEGRWETIGGMWVEADCNITGAESLARQFLLGRRYFLETFGKRDAPVLWLPDVFGYAWQLPQLIKEAGLSYFVTAKLSWNQYNTIPYDRFWWQGLDGTQILTYFITTAKPGWWGATYSAELSPAEIFTTWDRIPQKELSSDFMIAFGHGDGGGGPTDAMLENSIEMANHPGLPKVQLSKAQDFLERLERETGDQLPVWNGELYLELHRGTYTSQARNKKANRECEFLLHDAEFLSAWASLNEDFVYPHSELQRAWELLCLNQFHDIIPGSSIQQVYIDSLNDYEEIRQIGKQICDDALTALDRSMPTESNLVIYNPTSFVRSEIIALSRGNVTEQFNISTLDDTRLAVQLTEDHVLVELPEIPPYAYLALKSEKGDVPSIQSELYSGPSNDKTSDSMVLENALLHVEFDQSGDIIRLLDKETDREILVPGQKANQWHAFEDRPLDWDAWDIDIYYKEKYWLAEPASTIKVIENGPLRVGLEIRRRVLNSHIVQRVYLKKGSKQLDFKTHVDWQERHVLLKVTFPVNILSPKATYDIQWGNVERPTHQNTSWDWAQFESCAHKWIDLSEGDYGVSLLNDCKYGHDISGNVITLTALKGATFPDPEADLGEHEFAYSLLPHIGDWRNGTVPSAYALNNPLIPHHIQYRRISDSATQMNSLVRVNTDKVIIETIKQAESGDGLIVRLYENERTRQRFSLESHFSIAEVHRCNLLEENQEHINIVDNRVSLQINPYEIITLHLKFNVNEVENS